MPPSTSTRLISAMTSRRRPRRQGDPQSQLPELDVAPEGGAVEQGSGPVGLGALDLEHHRGPRQQLGDRPLADDVAPVHDGHGVAGALDLVEEVRRQHHGAALGHERQDHVAHLVHAGGVEPVHGLVEDQELGVPDQAGGHPEALAHAHGVLRHPVVGAMEDADPLEGRADARPARRALAPPRGAGGSAARSDGRGSGARRRWPRPAPARRRVAWARGSRAATSCRRRRGSGPAGPG